MKPRITYSCVEFPALFIELILKIEKFSFHDESFKKHRLANFANTFSFKRIHENLIIFKRSNTSSYAVFCALSFGV